MLVRVKVIPDSKKDEINQIGENLFEIKTKFPAKQGLANKAVVKLVADYFNLPENQIKITKGRKQKSKILTVKS